jgi:hypothetical protein
MHKNATKCNKTLSKWYKNKHGASKIMDTLEMYHTPVSRLASPASAIRKLCLVERKNPRWDLEEEDDVAKIDDNEEIRVFLGEPVHFIYK